MTATTYPRIHHARFGYEARRDRILARVELGDGSVRRLWLTRRLTARLIEGLSRVLAASHPAANRTPAQDEVLQMEHVAAVSAKRQRDAADAAQGHPGRERTALDAGPPQRPALATSVQLEVRDDTVVLGLQGLAADALEPDAASAEPLGAFALSRAQAHQILRMLRDQARRAEWNLDDPAAWMAPLKAQGRRTSLS